MKYNTIKENNQYGAIGIHGFGYKLFEEDKGGGVQEVLYGYPYLKHIIQLWPGDLVDQMEKVNEEVVEKNRLGGRNI